MLCISTLEYASSIYMYNYNWGYTTFYSRDLEYLRHVETSDAEKTLKSTSGFTVWSISTVHGTELLCSKQQLLPAISTLIEAAD